MLDVEEVPAAELEGCVLLLEPVLDWLELEPAELEGEEAELAVLEACEDELAVLDTGWLLAVEEADPPEGAVDEAPEPPSVVAIVEAALNGP